MVSAGNKERGNGCEGLGVMQRWAWGGGQGRENDVRERHNDRLQLLLLCVRFALLLLLLYSVTSCLRGGVYFFFLLIEFHGRFEVYNGCPNSVSWGCIEFTTSKCNKVAAIFPILLVAVCVRCI